MAKTLAMCRAVVFDFDGTLADSFDAIACSVNHVRALRGLPALSVAEVKGHVGHGPEYLLEHTIPGCRLSDDLPAYRVHHPTVMGPMTRLLPGAAELLIAIKHAQKRIGLCSNKPRIFSQELLVHLRIAELFDVVLGPEDVSMPKPSPEMLLRAMERMSLPRDEVLYVGDTTVDIQTARSAGVTVWVLPTGSEPRHVLEQARPDRLLENLHDMRMELTDS
ncbi:MAG: HAD family hydrolase [Gemmataceae bacterium]|nr:HAD family hydrolase [Gemmataceae bacterium]